MTKTKDKPSTVEENFQLSPKENNYNIDPELGKSLGTEKNIISNVINSTNPNTIQMKPSHSQGLNIHLNLKDKNMINMLKDNIENLEKEKNVNNIKFYLL